MSDHLQPSRPGGVAPAFFVLGLASGFLAALVIDRVAQGLFDEDIQLIRAVHRLAREEFVREVDPDQLTDDAIRGLVEGLDRYSRFYGPEDLARLDRETTGEFRGIGVVFRRSEVGQVLFPYPDSPATRAGLEVGDRITSIDGTSTAGMDAEEFSRTLTRGGDEIVVRAVDLEGQERELGIKPTRITDPTIRHVRMLDEERGIGYLALLSFSHRTPEEFDQAVSQLDSAGLEALVVDLRSNPGGILDAAVQLANRFIARGPLVATQTRRSKHVTEAQEDLAALNGLPLVLLIDSGSASASEVLAGALQDHGAASLVGEPTYGKGTVQTLERFPGDRAVVKITTANYYTPSGRSIERDPEHPENTGIPPDHLVEIPEDERQLIHAYLYTYSPPPGALEELRAWEERESLELVADPPEDRQLDAAVAILKKELPSREADTLR